jgi:peptide/nickel transport system substrate-binding protein
MEKQNKFSRRRFLHLSSVAAGGAMLAACSPGQRGNNNQGEGPQGKGGKGSVSKPPSAPSELKEAPMLEQMVDAGEIPSLEERLPEKPYVVPHKWLTSGKYGGNLLMITPATDDPSNKEYMYAHSLLRYLNDGLEIGPGLAESWESNDDASEWTLRFREGLKWSDGEPWTTQDIMFWWEDMALNEEHSEVPPDEARSGTGKLMEMSAPDDTTIVMSFDAPAPLTADRLAMWVNRGNGPGWMEPRHYMEQFHPKYGENVPKDWATEDGEFDLKRDWSRNPECPTMTGWRLKSYREGRNLVWERNPYYWCVDQEGAQLPYIDTITMSAVQDPEVGKLQIQEGKLDYVHGAFTSLELSDISGLKQTQDRSGMEVLLWDSGSGGGSTAMFNQDHPDEKLRELIRSPKFRQALSHGFDRDEAQKAIYFNTGEKTTGTLSPKAIEYQVNDRGRQVYEQWRDAYVEYDPEKAKSMLDEIGVTDQDGDGKREMPDGSKLTIRLDFPADTRPSHIQKNEFLARDWKAMGIDTQLNPVPPEGFIDQWSAGRLMMHTTWEIGDGPNHLVYPQFLVPIESGRWAPLQGQFYAVRGTPEENTEKNTDPYKRTPPRMEPEPGGPVDRLWKLYDQSKVEPDEMKRHRLVWDMIKVHIEDGPFMHGSVANYPRIVLAHKDLRNVPRKENLALGGFVNPWIHPTPAVYDPEAYYWDNPEEHS